MLRYFACFLYFAVLLLPVILFGIHSFFFNFSCISLQNIVMRNTVLIYLYQQKLNSYLGLPDIRVRVSSRKVKDNRNLSCHTSLER